MYCHLRSPIRPVVFGYKLNHEANDAPAYRISNRAMHGQLLIFQQIFTARFAGDGTVLPFSQRRMDRSGLYQI